MLSYQRTGLQSWRAMRARIFGGCGGIGRDVENDLFLRAGLKSADLLSASLNSASAPRISSLCQAPLTFRGTALAPLAAASAETSGPLGGRR